MSGIAERIVEDWLTNADERGYQASFVVSLIRQKHRVKYVSAHTVLEHGKDVISVSPTGELSAYQLKAGNIGLSAWRDMRGEVEELVLVPVTAGAGVKPRIADRAYLVTSGRVSDPARHQIELINAENQSLGRPTIELIERDELLGEFLSLFETFLPSGVPDAASVVALAAADGRGRPSGKELFPLFSAIAGSAVSRTRLRRASSELVAAAEFVSAPYRRAGNRISVIDVWVLAAAVLAKISLGGEVQRRAVRQGLDLVEMAVDEAADDLWAEVNESEDFLEGGLEDQLILPLRRLLVLGYSGARINSPVLRDREARADSETLVEILPKHIPVTPWGEGAWNLWINLVLAMRHTQLGVSTGEVLVERWLGLAAPQKATDALRDPYWTVEDTIEDFLDRPRSERSARTDRLSYTIRAAIEYFARRGWRNPVKKRWGTVSRTDQAETRMSDPASLFEWRAEHSWLHIRAARIEDSWGRIREEARDSRTALFDEIPWLLPYFMCAFPHRTNASLSGELDARTRSRSFSSY